MAVTATSGCQTGINRTGIDAPTSRQRCAKRPDTSKSQRVNGRHRLTTQIRASGWPDTSDSETWPETWRHARRTRVCDYGLSLVWRAGATHLCGQLAGKDSPRRVGRSSAALCNRRCSTVARLHGWGEASL